jgi:hypothetical protein
MQLLFDERPVSPEHKQRGVTRLWEVEKFPFKIRIGCTVQNQVEAFYWTLLGTYVRPEVALAHGRADTKTRAEDASAKALEGVLGDLRDWVDYAKAVL